MSGSLVHSPAQIISQLLIDLSLGTAPVDEGSWPIRFSGEADSPDNVITVYDAPGIKDGRSQIDGEVQEHHGIQVRVRAGKHGVGYTKARAIAIGLDESVQLNSVTISESVYLVYAISRTSDVLALGKDHPTSNLNLFTLNAVVALRQIT